MKTIILFPGDYFDIKSVDELYVQEYNNVSRFAEFLPVTFNYDGYLQGEKLKLYPRIEGEYFGIYRGWMLSPNKYEVFYHDLVSDGITLINSPMQYNKLHVFPNIYNDIEYLTPKTLWFEDATKIDWDEINRHFKKFMIKDYVKSVKGFDFPKFFRTPVEHNDMNTQVQRFTEIRGDLFTGGIVIKEYVDLKQYNDCTNECRVFYLNGEMVTISRNSSQPNNCSCLPFETANKFLNLGSNYYTIDFAEKSDGTWLILETGDGQVSGLSPNQYVFKYYDEIRRILK